MTAPLPIPEKMQPSSQDHRRIIVLGLTLGGVALALTIIFIIIFTHYGLPRDSDEYRRLQQRRAELAGQSVPAPATSLPPATSP